MFDWDEDNLRHIAEHGITPEEAEQAALNGPVDVQRQTRFGEERMLQIGVTDALQFLGLVTTWRGDLLRVVTAYRATPRQREFFLRSRQRGE